MMASATTTDSFDEWVQANGGDEELLLILKENGFTSKLSLKHLDLNAEEAANFRSRLNYGQVCLLKGLVRLLTPESYDGCSSKAITVGNKVNSAKPTLREKLGRIMFPSHNSQSTSTEFVPTCTATPTFTNKKAPKRKSSASTTKPKKKIKQVKLRVVALRHMTKYTPSRESRESMTYYVWLNCNASAAEVKENIAREVGVDKDSIVYLYAQGKNLRCASLEDIENADCWDVGTIRALMGSGSLYITCNSGDSLEVCSNCVYIQYNAC